MIENRDRQIIRTSIVGIIVNILLSVFKIFVGLLTNSIAIVLDAVNNLSDAASSIITIIGTKLAGKAPDKKHPFGYGRVEYFSELVISVIILYAGITSLKESISSIIHPEAPSYTSISLVIVAVAIVVKIVLGRYFVGVGKKVDSGSLVASGKDATLDSIISAGTLAAALIYIFTNISLEAYLGAIISVVIIRAGIQMMRETISKLLGERADATLAKEIKDTIRAYPEVTGAYDLVINDYGPDRYQGSVHIEVPDTYSINDLDELIRTITVDVYMKHHVVLTAIGIYSNNTSDYRAQEVKAHVEEIVLANKYVTQLHGFYLNEEKKSIRFDMVIDFDAGDLKAVYMEALSAVKKEYPEYEFSVAMDTDFS